MPQTTHRFFLRGEKVIELGDKSPYQQDVGETQFVENERIKEENYQVDKTERVERMRESHIRAAHTHRLQSLIRLSRLPETASTIKKNRM